MTNRRRSTRRTATSGATTPACRAYSEPPPAPRPVPWSARGAKARIFLFCGGLLAVVTTFMLLVVGVAPWRDAQLDRRGQPATATPTGLRDTNLSEGPAQGHDSAPPAAGRRYFDITVAYADTSGAQRQATLRTASPQVIKDARKKKPIDIEYDPEDFSAVRVKGEYAHPFRDLTWVPVIGAVFGWALVIVALRLMRRAGRLYRHGVATTGLVERVDATWWHDGHQVFEVHYAYQTPAGKMHGATKTTRPPREGETIWVLYDEADLEQSVAPC